MRLFGFLLGTGIALGILFTATGLPELPASRPLPTAAQDDSETLPPPEPTQQPAPETADEPAPAEPAAVVAEPAPAPDEEPAVASAPEPEPATTAPARTGPAHWYAFWSPFRSRLAAEGFVSQLQRVTGLDYRVVNVKPGVYEVAFAYATDAEIAGNLAQIAAATGLQLPES